MSEVKTKVRSSATHLAGIDGLRAFAALAVLFSHTAAFSVTAGSIDSGVYKLSTFGDQGLTLFFAISGFLLFLPFVSALLADRPMPSIRRYFANRGLRIFPAYIVIFFLVLAAGALSIHGNTVHYVRADIGRISDPSVFVPNVFLVQSLVPHANGTGIIPAWSLTAELTFYALLPLVGYLAWFLAKRVSKVVALAAGPVLFLVVTLVTTYFVNHNRPLHGSAAIFRYDWGNTWSSVLERSFLANADLFAWGMFAALAIGMLRQRDKMPRLARGTKALSLVVIVAVAFAARHNEGRYAISLVGICAAVLIFLTVLPSHDGERVNGLARVLEWGPIRYVGLISYSVYLWHLPVILFLKEHGVLFKSGNAAFVGNLIIVAAFVLALASITYYLVEKPAMNLRGLLPVRTIELAPTASDRGSRPDAPMDVVKTF
jgi:peptidoglycan/LPS O-acetylase OafA/YrhL